MSAVTKTLAKVEDAVVSVGKAVDNVGQAIVEDVVKPVASAVDDTVQAALQDPVNTAIRIGAMVVGGPAGLAIANGTIALAQGASIEDAALTAGKTYVIGQAGTMAGQAAGAAAAEAGYGAYAAGAAQGATAGATRALLSGGDAETGALMGALGGLNSTAAKDITDTQFTDWAQSQPSAWDNAPSPTEQDVLAADPSIKMDFPLETATTATGPGYYDEISGAYVPSETGGLSSPLTEASGTDMASMSDYKYDPATGTWTAPNGEVLSSDTVTNQPTNFATQNDNTLGKYDPLATRSQVAGGLNFITNAILGGTSGTAQNAPTANQPTAKAPNQSDTLNPNWISATEMLGDSTGDPFQLAKLKQLYDTLTPEMQQTLATNNGQKQPTGTFLQPENQVPQMASGGSAWDNLVNSAYTSATTKTNQPVFMGGGQRKIAQLTPLTQLSNQIVGNIPRKATGGLPALHGDIPKDHKPEFVTGHTGYYATGKGTGQSDEIPAVLQHGDFVVDADTVAALGDGSSKAGAQALEQFRKHIPVRAKSGGRAIPAQIADGEYVLPEAFVTALGQGDNARGAKLLDEMRKNVREHKRSAPTSKIPPKAKSPLEYIKMGKKG